MLQNKVAVITGAAGGIGEAAARLFVKEGARVVLGDIRGDKLEALAKELGGPKVALPRVCDVCEEGDVEALVGAAIESFGRLDVMCANAGYAGKNMREDAMMVNLETAEFDKQVSVNLRGVALCIKHAGRAMKAAGNGGCIINTASIASLKLNCSQSGDPVFVSAGEAAAVGYSAAKAGVIHLVKLGACKLCESGIRVNGVAPGFVVTPMVQAVVGKSKEETKAWLESISPMPGVAIMPEDIANAMLFLASDMGRCVNGHTLLVDNGMPAGAAGFTYKPKQDIQQAVEQNGH